MIASEINLFKGIDFEIMKEITEICVGEAYDKGTVLFEGGESAEYLYILESGSLDLVVKNGGSFSFKLTEPGEVFGWSSMAESGKYTASGVCDTDLKAVKIEMKKLNRIFHHHPDVGLKVLRRLVGVFASRLSNAYQAHLHLLSSQEVADPPTYG